MLRTVFQPGSPWLPGSHLSQLQRHLAGDEGLSLEDVASVVPGLVNLQKAIENGPVEIVSFPLNSMVDLSIVM